MTIVTKTCYKIREFGTDALIDIVHSEKEIKEEYAKAEKEGIEAYCVKHTYDICTDCESAYETCICGIFDFGYG